MKKIFFLVGLGLLVNNYAGAQTLQKGYIVRSNHEKTVGYLEETTDDELRTQVVFSTGLRNEKTVYTPADLESFGFDYGRTFESFLIPGNGVQKSVFAKKIWTGKIDIYTVQFDNNVVEYILKNNLTGEWVLLKRPANETRTESGVTMEQRDLKYLQQLAAIKKDSAGSYVKQTDINYSRSAILANIKAYDVKYKDQYPVKYYVEKRAKLYGVTGGYQIFNAQKGANSFRINVFRDLMLIERSKKIAFHQGISYAWWYKKTKTNENKFSIMNFSLLGMKLQADPLFASPFFNVGAGFTLRKYPVYSYSWTTVTTTTGTDFYFSIQAAMGVKFRLSPSCYLLSICSYENSAFALNAGFAYYYSKKKN